MFQIIAALFSLGKRKKLVGPRRKRHSEVLRLQKGVALAEVAHARGSAMVSR